MYGEITAMSAKEGYCWASNGYFAKLYGVDKRTITRWITNLKDCGFVTLDLIYYTNSKRVRKRKITLVKEFSPRMTSLSLGDDDNVSRAVDDIVLPPIDANVQDNNTSINNIKKNSTRVSTTRATEVSPQKQHPILDTIDIYHNTCCSLMHYKYNQKDLFSITNFINTVGDVKGYFEKVNESDFLSGRNGKWKLCNFKWLINPVNMQKVLDGNYQSMYKKSHDDGNIIQMKKEGNYDYVLTDIS
jgi:hypothetical protein